MKNNTPKISIIGESGTTGLRLRDRLSRRDDIELVSLPDDDRKNQEAIHHLAEETDLMFLCLPDAAAKEIAELAKDTDVRILDTSTAHRTKEDWIYGFPELSKDQSEKIKTARKVAVPGCHASGCISILYPLIHAGVLPVDYPVHCVSLTGYSGGGKKMIAEYEADELPKGYDSPRQYGLSQIHKHLPEIREICGLEFDPLFSPVVADYYSGMEVTIGFHSRLLGLPCGLSGSVSIDDFHEIFLHHYKNSPVIHVSDLPLQETNSLFLSADEAAGKDSMTIYISGNDDRILVSSVFDNLGKGASGAAVECMNLMLGLPPETGLDL